MEKDGEATPRSDLTTPVTWFGCLSVQHALVVLHTMLLTTAILGTTLMAIYLAQHMELMQVDDLLISASGLTLWASAVGITLFGMGAIWSKHIGFVGAYFWIQPVLWILDLACMIVLLVFAYQKRESLAQASCVNKPNIQLCLETFRARLVLMTIGLCIYKIIGAYAWYLLFGYRKALLAIDHDKASVRWSRRTSASSISSIFEKKWWSPSQIPVIKIDFASDESSASVYSNDSPGYRNIAFGVQYPTLAVLPQAVFASHLGGEALAPGARQAYPDAPSLPTYSVVGSERGALT